MKNRTLNLWHSILFRSENLANIECDLDMNFYQDSISSFETEYFSLCDFRKSINRDKDSVSQCFMWTYEVWKRLTKYEKFKELMFNLGPFVSKTWLELPDETNNSLSRVPKYKPIHKSRINGRRGAVSIFLKKSFSC